MHLKNWPQPTLQDFESDVQKNIDHRIREAMEVVTRQIFHHLQKLNLLSRPLEMHEELTGLLAFPYSRYVFEHYINLRFFESYFQRKFKVLDVGCGSGEFSFWAQTRGHAVIAFDSRSEDDPLKEVNGIFDLLDLKRLLCRRVFIPSYLNIKVAHNKRLFLDQQYFDVIYLNQASFHFSKGDALCGYWNGRNWYEFLNELIQHLTSEGLIFLTWGRPTYTELSPYLKQFSFRYEEHFPHTNIWDGLLLSKKDIDKAQNRELAFGSEWDHCYETISYVDRSSPNRLEQVIHRQSAMALKTIENRLQSTKLSL